MSEIWLTRKKFEELIETGEVETDTTTIKLTDYVYSRIDGDMLE